MSGQTSRFGFRFQDLYLLRQVFMDIANQKRDEIAGKVHKEKQFGVEARTPVTGTTDWDILVIGDEKHTVLEVKSGAVSQKDRVSFWLRIREEIFHVEQKESIYPGLVINSDNLPAAFEALSQLSERANFDDYNKWTVPLEPPKRVAKEKQLIEEALYWICSAKASGERKLVSKVSKEFALSVLARFKLFLVSGKELEQKVESMIERLTFITEPSVLRHQLEGWVNHCATSEVDKIHLFTVSQMIREIKLLEKFLEQDSDVLRLAQLLKNEYNHGCLSNWKGKFTKEVGLQPKSLKEVQYNIFKIDWNTQLQSIALLADAGYGKSRSLYELNKQLKNTSSSKFEIFSLMSEDVVSYLSEEKKSVLLGSLLLLVDLAVLCEKRLILLVDGLDQIAKPQRAMLSSLLHTVSQREGFLGVVTCRKVDWNEQGKLKENLQTWQKLFLTEWPETVVRSVLKQHGISRDVSKGIKTLIRIPLYLDIFIRVFAGSSITGEYVQTRHGLLNAYWEHVVLNEQHLQIWKVLKEACEQISNKNYWVPSGKIDDGILESLISSGLITRVNSRARYDFRHSLLRDFAIAQWILEESEEDPDIIASRLDAVQSSVIIRFGAQRALLEAISDVNELSHINGCTIEEYVFHASDHEKEQIARILGGLFPNMAMNIKEWNKKPKPNFVDSLIRSAQYHLNSDWVSVFSTWSSSKIWVEQQTWIGEGTIERLANYLEVIAGYRQNHANEGRNHIQLIANTILEWTKARKFQTELRKNDSWVMMHLIPTICRWANLELVIDWLSKEILRITGRTRHTALEYLVLLADRVQTEKKGYSKLLGELYCRLIGLSHDGHFPTLDKTIASENMLEYYVIDWSLLGTNSIKAPPLIDQLPCTFFPITLDLLLAIHLNENYIASYRQGSEVEVQSGKKLLDDQSGYYYWNSIYENDMEVKLLKGVHRRLKNWLATKPEFFIDQIIPFILNSPLASIRIFLIQLFLEEKNGEKLFSVVKEMILDERIYHVRGSHYWLVRTFQTMWDSVKEEEIMQIYSILINVSHSDYINGVYVAGILLSSISISDSEDLKSILKNFHEQEYSTILRDPREEIDGTVWKNVSSSDNKRYILSAVGEWDDPIDKELMIKFYERMNELVHPNNSPSVDKINNVIVLLEHVLPGLAASLNQLKINTWPIRELQHLLKSYHEKLETAANRAELLPIPAETSTMIAQIATALLQHSSLPETPENFSQGHSMMIPTDSWTESLFLLEQVMREDTIRNRDDIFDIVYTEIKKVYSQTLPYQQYLCVLAIPEWHWFRTDKKRVELLEELILGDTTTGSALSWGIRLLECFTDTQLDQVIRKLLSKKSIPFIDEFLTKLGKLVGYRALLTNHKNERLFARNLVDDIITKPSEFPLLDDDKNQVDFLTGIVFGLKEVACISVSNNQLAYEYGDWLLRIWEKLKQKESYREKDLILFAMHWIVNPEKEMKITDLLKWWQSIYSMVKRVIIEGERPEVFTVIFGISRNKIEMIHSIDAVELINLFILRILANPDELDARNPQKHDYHSWREVADYAAEVIHQISGRVELTRTEREQCYVLLSKLASQPIQSSVAERILIRLQVDIE
ncbi:hypothetical protein RCG17_20035 [Neobacillus sp. PS3-12]|uniref:hypothetical protein n=1 Tax=Neobacillus sp. PS3-12 TaxID=3070677 RepID=UPI0027E00CBA|nr:hypothetical protein [Neobacillus sp. PS3-12]WML51703.1 hypothetical protein RCG17_20035 [Neobacillus sp. PS3-12]